MTAKEIAKALGGRKAGAVWMARCPAHDDRNPSLAIADANSGKVLVHCHAGCDQRDVIAALQAQGPVESTGQGPRPIFPKSRSAVTSANPIATTTNRTEAALAIWRASHLPEGNAG